MMGFLLSLIGLVALAAIVFIIGIVTGSALLIKGLSEKAFEALDEDEAMEFVKYIEKIQKK